MLTMRRFLLMLMLSMVNICVYGQDDDFCDALNAIARDAPNKFRNIKGNVMQETGSAVTWACGVKVPGTISSRFVASMGLFYEGAVFQAKNKEELKAIYDKYRGQINACLAPQGYIVSLSPNFAPGLENLKKVVFMKEPGENIKPDNAPAHMAMEALYSKETRLYVIVVYIYEH
jgi:hypothetical protein